MSDIDDRELDKVWSIICEIVGLNPVDTTITELQEIKSELLSWKNEQVREAYKKGYIDGEIEMLGKDWELATPNQTKERKV